MTAGTDQGQKRYVALCGGVGGAKLAFGLSRLLGDRLTVIVNCGDDFDHFDLRICPDIDTVLYTLSGLANRKLGWGRADESWNFMETVAAFGGETWFNLGDRDLALHVLRTRALNAGLSLTEFVADAARRLSLASAIVPMTDDAVRTVLETSDGILPFQRYFVERRCEPWVERIFFHGAESARPSPSAAAALADPGLAGIILCPSNPYLSIDPILAVAGMRELIAQAAAPVVAVSPIIGGKAVKGPTAKIMSEIGMEITNRAIAWHYRGLLDGLVIDSGDSAEATQLGLPSFAVPTLMSSDADRIRLAGDVLAFADELASSDRRRAS